MTRNLTLHGFIPPAVATLALSGLLMLGVSGTANAQSRGHHARGSGNSGGGQTAKSSPPPAQGSAPVETRAGSGGSPSGDSSRSGGDSGRSGRAVARGGGQAERGGNDAGKDASGTTAGGTRTRGTSSADGSVSGGTATPPYSRPRDGRNATGEAVERRPGSNGGSTTVVVTNPGYYGGGYYPWGFGGLGFAGYYGAGYYDPFGYDGYDYGQSSSSSYGYDGALRLKVKPRDASVYIDGYFAGRVDDFDGVFQRLRIEPGPHRVELRLDGYEPLAFEVRIQPDRTLTYTAELKSSVDRLKFHVRSRV